MNQTESGGDLGRRQPPLERIVAHQSKFLHFLGACVGDAANAEDILQSPITTCASASASFTPSPAIATIAPCW